MAEAKRELAAAKARGNADEEQDLHDKVAYLRDDELDLLDEMLQLRDQELELLEIRKLLRRPPPPPAAITDAALGEATLDGLKQAGTMVHFEGGLGPSVLTEPEQALLASSVSEEELVSRLTPHISRLRVDAATSQSTDDCRQVLVNSEHWQWVDVHLKPLEPGKRTKPDLFVTSHAFVEYHAGQPGQGSSDGYLFGRLASPKLQKDGCVRELYAIKLQPIECSDVGEMIKHHMLIPGEVRGMLCNDTEFLLFATVDGQPSRAVRCLWTTSGSAQLVRDFFDVPAPDPPPLRVALRELLLDLHVRCAFKNGSAFMGAGGSCRVFRVESEQADASTSRGATLVLKVGIPRSDDDQFWQVDVSHEFNALERAHGLGAPVVAVVPGSIRLLDYSAGFLMQCAGARATVASAADCTRAFVALRDLHACRVLHGDARLPNLLRSSDELSEGKEEECALLWVDPLDGSHHPDMAADKFANIARLDAYELVRSVLELPRKRADADQDPFLGRDPGEGLDGGVKDAVEAYDVSAASATALAAAVWRSKLRLQETRGW